MKARIFTTLLLGGLLAAQVGSLHAQDTRFFRIVGPVPTTIMDVTAEGTVTWTNLATNATFTVQTATALPDATNWVDWVQVPVTNAVTVHRIFDPNPPPGMAFIPAGSFTMGDNFNDSDISWGEGPTHTVYVSALYLDRFEVTKALWDEVYNWAITHDYSFEYSAASEADNYPVHWMTWHDAVKWCNARSEWEGRVPAYFTSAAQTTVYRSGQVDVQNDWVKWNSGYRLPTEAEWEKAARGGTSGRRFPWSDSDTIQHSRANYYSSTSDAYDTSPTRGHHPTFATGDYPHTNPVGYYAPNGYGLYDMAGNVWEWCWDWWSSTYYNSSPSTDPRGPLPSGWYHVIRGGSWDYGAVDCRAARRNHGLWPDYRGLILGFRCALPSGQ